MSLKSFLHHLWDAIGSIFQHAAKEVKEVALPTAIAIVDAIKSIVDADELDIIGHIVKLIGADNEDWLRKHLPEILIDLRLINAASSFDNLNEVLRVAINQIKNSSDRSKAEVYHGMAVMLAHDLADGKLTWSEAVELAEFYFKNKAQLENGQH